MVQMEARYRKLSLRLDNGAVIGHSEKLLGDPSGGPVLLPVDKAFSRGLVTEQQVKRLEELLVHMHSRAPNAAPLRSLSDINRKRKEPDSAQDQAAHQKAAHLNSGRRGGKGDRHSVGNSLGGSSWGGGDFYAKCSEVLTEVEKHLGQNLVIFAAPVDGRLYPEYHKVVKQPMDLGTIHKSLDGHQYSNPQEFCDDMRQVWINCALFNQKDSVVGKIGSRADAKFEQLWAASGYDQGGRRRRVTGGIAAHKYEPSLDPEPKPPARKTSSGQRNGRRSALRPEAESQFAYAPSCGPRRARSGTAAAARSVSPPELRRSSRARRISTLLSPESDLTRLSPEISYSPEWSPSPEEGLQRMKSVNHKPMPQETMQLLAERLGTLAEDESMEQILAIIREEQPVDISQNNGEVELDFDKLEPATLWRLYDFTENMNGPIAISPADSEPSDSDDSGDDLD